MIASQLMRIPPSVFVMALVTAVPFGLGIRDTLTAKRVAGSDAWEGLADGQSRAERERQLADYEAEQRREDAEREARAAQHIAQLDQLFGPKPAAMGALFDGVQLGAAGADLPQDVRKRLDDTMRDGFITVTFDGDDSALFVVAVTLASDDDARDTCDQLGAKLAAAWGHSVAGVWIDPAAHQRATLVTGEPCELRFERYLDASDFVAKLPFAAIGGRADALATQLGAAVEAEGDHLYWTLPGVGASTGTSRVTAFSSDDGRIVGFTVASAADFDSTTAIRDALAKQLGGSPERSIEEGEPTGSVVWEWKRGRAPVTLEETAGGTFSISAGTMSWD